MLMEAATRLELVNKGFADLCLTTWLRRHVKNANCKYKKFFIECQFLS